MNMVEYSKAKYHLENLKSSVDRADNLVNSEDISIKFLYDCMKERIEELSNMERNYKLLIDELFGEDNMIYLPNSRFYIFKNMKDLKKYKNNHNIDGDIIKDIAVFLTDKSRIYVPESELDGITEPYIYLGKYMVLWCYK